MKTKIVIFGEEMKRCTYDYHQCDGIPCAEDISLMCSYQFDLKLARKSIEYANILAKKVLDSELQRKPLGAEHIDAAKRIIEISEQFTKVP